MKEWILLCGGGLESDGEKRPPAFRGQKVVGQIAVAFQRENGVGVERQVE